MKPGQSTFDERLKRINKGKTLNAADISAPRSKQATRESKTRRLHWDMLVSGAVAGTVAGTLFAKNIGFLFLISLDYLTVYGLVLADTATAAYLAAMLIAPIGFLFTLILSRTAQKALQFWSVYCVAALGTNATELRYWIETSVIPGFWQFMENYTAATSL